MKQLPAVVFLVGILIMITWLNFSTDSDKSNGTPLREYRLMDEDKQKLAILESRRALFHKYLEHKDIERASCVAQLFVANTEEGTKEFGQIEEYIQTEIDRDMDQMTEMIVNTFIKTNFCPPSGIRSSNK